MCAVQGDDYVIYCHPSKQKNPRASHLRDWYHTLLDEAARRGIVTFRSTLFDSFFEGGKDHALAAATSRNLPYFDGDFWPGEAETQLNDISTGKAPAGAPAWAGLRGEFVSAGGARAASVTESVTRRRGACREQEGARQGDGQGQALPGPGDHGPAAHAAPGGPQRGKQPERHEGGLHRGALPHALLALRGLLRRGAPVPSPAVPRCGVVCAWG